MTDDFKRSHVETARETSADVSPLACPSEILPDILQILPLNARPLFPAQALPLILDREPWLHALELASETAPKIIGLVLVRGDIVHHPTPEDFYTMGTACRVQRMVQSEDKMHVVVEGVQRFRVEQWIAHKSPFVARPQYCPETTYEDVPELAAYSMAIIGSIKELSRLNPVYGDELKHLLNRFGPQEPARLADFAAALTAASKQELQEVLEATHILDRVQRVLVLLSKEAEEAKAQARIHAQVQQKVNEQQRQFFLRQQLKAIQKELGIAKDDRSAELDLFHGRLPRIKPAEPVRRRIDEEMQKLAVLEVGSPEYAVTRNYLDWLTVLPWGTYSENKIDLDYARKVLDQDHYGLEDVKERIIEFLGVGAMKGEIGGSILLLVGPPGVGKTSIGRSIATALGRKFYRLSVGGMRDEAEIKGHRRTYIGALPGKFIHAIREAGVANPVIMLDEVDKIGSSYHGDPAAALLEVLDPEQNADFLDHYLDVRFDLSKVLFVCTANQLDTIPRPLLDRMEVIRLAGYITSEKLAIAKHHLLPRQLQKAGLKRGQLQIDTAAICAVIEGYAREAGVRGLEKKLGTLARKAVVSILRGTKPPIRISAKNLEEYLDRPVFRPVKPLHGVGVATGLAWTPLGGASLDVEAQRVHAGNRGFKLTGQLGDVMRESAEIAYSYIAAHCKQYRGKKDFFDKAYVHLHVPAGSVPKDGPSAGIAMATALLSLARGEKLARTLAMTGEITLTGHVLPVGGIREKVIAARRVKIPELILPAANKKDLEGLPEHVRKGVAVHYVSHYRDIVPIVFSG